MIEVNETKPVEPSLTIVLTGEDVPDFKAFLYRLGEGKTLWATDFALANEIREAVGLEY